MEIFLSGLNDEKIIKALREQNPTDLNEVLSLVKSINVVNVNTSSNIAGVHKYDEKNSEINELKKQVTHLTQLVFSLRKNISEILGKNNTAVDELMRPLVFFFVLCNYFYYFYFFAGCFVDF